MSILLETLNHQENDKQVLSSSLPNVHSSHYDDEMLGDEWLYQRLNKWRLISLFLFVSLLTSWAYFIFNSQSEKNDEQLVVSSQLNPAQFNSTEITSSEQKITEQKAIEKKSNDANSADLSLVEQVNKNSATNNLESNKQIYVPQKREVTQNSNSVKANIAYAKPANAQPVNDLSDKIIRPSQQENSANHSVKSKQTDFDKVIDKDSLSQEQLKYFPEIEINSYVVADNAEDSFVILDGSFYKINQMIANNLVLRQITSDYMVVEFEELLVRIKFK